MSPWNCQTLIPVVKSTCQYDTLIYGSTLLSTDIWISRSGIYLYFTGMFATVERTELATGTNNTPLPMRTLYNNPDRGLYRLPQKVGNTLLIIETIRTVRTTDHPKIIQIGRLDNNCIRCLFLDLLSTKIKYLPGCILLYGFDLGKFFQLILPAMVTDIGTSCHLSLSMNSFFIQWLSLIGLRIQIICCPFLPQTLT